MDIFNSLLENGLLTALFGCGGVIGGIFLNRYFDRKNRKDEIKEEVNTLKTEVEELKQENCLLCYGISACLDGLEQLGANHTVPKAKLELEKHLNKKAHGVEE